MSGRKKVPSRGSTIASHFSEHPALNLARLDRHEHVADWDGNSGHFLDASKTARVCAAKSYQYTCETETSRKSHAR